jgi:hypothetical protein
MKLIKMNTADKIFITVAIFVFFSLGILCLAAAYAIAFR